MLRALRVNSHLGRIITSEVSLYGDAGTGSLVCVYSGYSVVVVIGMSLAVSSVGVKLVSQR